MASAEDQKVLRRRRGERAFIFDQDLARCLGDADRDEWDFAITLSAGNVSQAAEQCGIDGVPRGAKACSGRSAEEALATYWRWQQKRG
jgi:hypothetical protein